MTKPLLLLALAAAPAFAQSRIGAIDFFGYKGIDVAKVRAAVYVTLSGGDLRSRGVTGPRRASASTSSRVVPGSCSASNSSCRLLRVSLLGPRADQHLPGFRETVDGRLLDA